MSIQADYKHKYAALITFSEIGPVERWYEDLSFRLFAHCSELFRLEMTKK